jgi:LGFP repeat
MSVVDEPVIVYRFRTGKVESTDGSYEALLRGISTHALHAPLVLPRGPALDQAAAFVGGSGLCLPAIPALVDAACFAVDMLIRIDRDTGLRMQLLAAHAPCMALALEPGPDNELDLDGNACLYLRGEVHLGHAGAAGAHWCGAQSSTPLLASSDTGDTGDTASQHAFPASNVGWVCVALVFTGDDLLLLQDGVVVARRAFRAAVLAPVPGPRDVHAVGADLDGRHVLQGAVAAVRLWNGVPALYSEAIDAAERAGMGALAGKRAELEESGMRDVLGDETRAERGLRLAGTPGRVSEHERGVLMWSRDTGAHAVRGAIHGAYQVPGWRGRLGWPIADERTSSAGARVQRFQRGAIVWSSETGAHPVFGPLFARYLALGGERGSLGLPVQAPHRIQRGMFQELQRGRLVHDGATGAHALHGPVLARYLALPRRLELLGHPVSDTGPIHGPGGALLGHVSHFERGAIYWSAQNGAWEVCGRLLRHYQWSGGPLGGLGFPVAEAHDFGPGPGVVPGPVRGPVRGPGATTHARFERGLIVHRADLGTCALYSVRLRLERVRRLRNASTRAFAVRVWLRTDGDWVHRGTRLPAQGYASTSVALAQTHVLPVQPETELWMKIEVCDHDQGDRVIGAIEQRFDIDQLWGIWSGNRGRHEQPIAVDRDSHGFALAFRAMPAASVVPARLPPDAPGIVGSTVFPRLGWWRFGNFRTRTLERDLLDESFRAPLPPDSACWPEPPPAGLPGLLEEKFYDMAHAGMAANGSCFGLVTTSVHALASSSRLSQPVRRYHLTPDVRDEIVRRQAQQLGAEVIAWFASLLARPEQLSPRAVFDRVERALHAHMPVPLCIYDVPGDRGDCVLAYACTRAGEEYGRIYVADPNAPRSQGSAEAAFVRVLADDTFQLAHQPERFRSQRASDEILPDVLLLPVPFHVLAHASGMPLADPGLALQDLLGGLVLLSGDAEMEQIASRGQELHRKQGGRRYLAAHAPPGLIRVPRLQASPSSQVYAQHGPLSEDLELHVKGTKARGGRFVLCVGMHRGEVCIEAAIHRGALDTVVLRELRTSAVHLHLSTTMPGKLASVACRVHRDPRGRAPRVVTLEVPLAPGDAASVHVDGPGGAVIVRPSGPPRSMDVLLETPQGGELQRIVLRGLVPGAAGEALCIRPRDWSALGGEIIVERRAGVDGAVLARQAVRGQAP